MGELGDGRAQERASSGAGELSSGASCIKSRVAAHNIKTYPAPWQGQLILACRKCQKKLKHDPGLRGLATLKKAVKRYNKQHAEAPLHVLNVPCMDLCPKDGVTVCNPARRPAGLSILRSEEEIGAILGHSELSGQASAASESD